MGLIGLAIVAAITAIAFALPNPEASATDGGEDSVTITVTVEEQQVERMARAEIVSPVSGSTLVNRELTVQFKYWNTTSANVTLTLEKKDGTTETVSLPVSGEDCRINGNGICTITYDMSRYPFTDTTPNAVMNFRVDVTPKYNGQAGVGDNVEFFYRAATVKYEGIVDSATKDPYVSIDLNDAVDHIKVQAYRVDGDGKPVFAKDGVEMPLELTREQLEAYGGQLRLPFTEYGAEAGYYVVVVMAYNADGDLIAIATDTVPYKVDGQPGDGSNTPGVPGTGSIWRDLNISRADYLTVGLLAFGMVTGFAIYLIVRRSKR